MSKRLIYIFIYIALATALPSSAQRVSWQQKLSPWLRSLAKTSPMPKKAIGTPGTVRESSPTVIAFIKTADSDDRVLDERGCRSLARYGRLHIAAIPIHQLTRLAADSRVERIEARPSGHALTDSMAIHLNATQAYTGEGLPQAYTGQGVVLGLMDVGFDLTHPNFYSRDLTDYRIRRFWDQISIDTVGSSLPVGRDFVTTDDMLALGHSRDGLDLTHGTHTLGIAAGSGYDTNYRGMAPEADICIVANAVSEDLHLIDSADVYKYTFATDALGFKYIFDYAQQVGKPCVASFSEGSGQDLYGWDQLYYEMLDSLVGPGRILVAAAGNQGTTKSYMQKRRGQPSAGTFIYRRGKEMMFTLRSADDFALRLVSYTPTSDTLVVQPRQAFLQPDSVLTDSLADLHLLIEAYPSSYDPTDLCYDVTVSVNEGTLSGERCQSIELLGIDAEVELWRVTGYLVENDINPRLCDSEFTHNVHSPSSAPCVVSVGAITSRNTIINMQGETMVAGNDVLGLRADFSSTGPTMDGRIKPDCVAPGRNIVSSYSSYYLESHPDAGDIAWDVAHYDFRGRTYAWNANTGTSQSTPAVAGAIALWLQACPTLTPTDVMDLLRLTCRHPDPSLSYPNNEYGYGEVDVYAGLLHLLNFSSIPDVPAQHTSARIGVAHHQLHIVLPQPSATPLALRVYDVAGRPVFKTQLPQGQQEHTIALPSLPAAVYAVCIGQESTLVRIDH
ncbi:MAG: S8 family serine peptidase [Prevotella sp.]|nr:S8 family serine peptidase [Prevotella sp.]